MNQENEKPSDTLIELEPLTNDDLALIAAYFKNNQIKTRAYLAIHPSSSYDSARSSAPIAFAKPSIQAEIKRILTENLMSEEEAIWRIGAIAKADLFPFIRIDDDGFTYFNFSDEQAQEYLFLIKKLKTKRERRLEGQGKNTEEWEGEWMEVELHDAYQALRDIAKMKGKLSEKLDLSNSDGSLKPETMSPSEILARADALRKQIKDANNS